MHYFFSQLVFAIMHLPFCSNYKRLTSCQGSTLLYVFCSTWVMINLQTRKVAKIPEAMRQKLARFAPNPLRCTCSTLGISQGGQDCINHHSALRPIHLL